jgi:murein DD-endopeptidase MepM/ murein hydrolase activator NlpD
LQRIRLSPALVSALALGLVAIASPAYAGSDASTAPPVAAPAGVVPFETEEDLFEPDTLAPASDAAADADSNEGGAPSAERNPRRGKASKGAARDRKSAPSKAITAAPAAVEAEAAEPMRTDFNLTALSSSPVPGVESSGFGWRADPLNNRRKFHKGTDFRAPRGTPVFAAGGGVVTFAGRMGGYGNVVFIDHGGGVLSRYGHLRRIGTVRNAQVVAGAQIGEVGSTGRATGPHLHFEVRLDGRAVNPSVAMSLGALQRVNPEAARSAMATLAPEVQAASVDPHPHHKAGKRPERRGRAKRSQNLW